MTREKAQIYAHNWNRTLVTGSPGPKSKALFTKAPLLPYGLTDIGAGKRSCG